MDWILTKLDGFFRSGCGRLSTNVVNLPNAREHLERGFIVGTLSTVGMLLTMPVPLWARLVAIFCLLVALGLQMELIITELRQHSANDWWRVTKFCFRVGVLTPAEIKARKDGGPLDGVADLFFKTLTGLPLYICLIIIITGVL